MPTVRQQSLTGYNNAPRHSGALYGQLMTAAHDSCHWPAAAHSVSMGSMLDAANHLEITASVLQTTSKA